MVNKQCSGQLNSLLLLMLGEDFEVHYRADRQVSPETAAIKDGFFAITYRHQPDPNGWDEGMDQVSIVGSVACKIFGEFLQ